MVPKSSKSLVVVESPAKAKTIQKYLGSAYDIKASVGHVMDLPPKELGVDIEHDFKPTYEVMRGKKKVLNDISKAANKVDKVYLAPDPDREGEAIAKHIADYIKENSGKKTPEIYRILINEITKTGITKALEHPAKIDIDKFNSQQARRVLDRLVGYQISPILWKKVKRGLSAGRVQSVAVRLIVEREREIENFKPEEYWILEADFDVKGQIVKTKLFKIGEEKAEIKDEATANQIMDAVKNGRVYIHSVEKKERKRNPQAPFITSRLQQDAARKLRYTAKRTMGIAQGLYEGVELGEEGAVGLITYMRTDSTRVSDEALKACRDYIKDKYGKDYLPEVANVYKSKKSAQDAHEAIRPTHMEYEPERVKQYLTDEQLKLYTLIWNRFVASQMEQAIFDQTTIDIAAQKDSKEYIFRATGSILKFAGYTKIYEEATDDENEEKEENLPDCDKNTKAHLSNIVPFQKFTQPPARFNEATLVKELEENGIGRPSTYASIISTIQDRGYADKDGHNFKPTELGKMVTDLLIGSFPEILDVDFTAGMENKLDEVEEGNTEWVSLLKDFYKGFVKRLKEADKNMRDLKKEETPTDVKCPKCNGPMVIKWGRNGQFLACSNYPECKSTMNFHKEQTGQIVAEQKETTDEKCPKCGSDMVIKSGRFGKFLACSKYPECKTTKSMTTGVPCPECDNGELAERSSRKGKTFFSCSTYPKCKFATWDKPIKRTCPQCNKSAMADKGDHFLCLNKTCEFKEDKVG